MAHRHIPPHFLRDSELSRELQPPALFSEEHTRPHASRTITPKNSDSVRYPAKTKDKPQSKD